MIRSHSLRLARVLFAAALGLAVIETHADAPAPTKEQQKFEVRFLTNMIDHHAMAVEMAKLCEGRAVHPEFLEMCAQIQTSQAAEIETMRSWLQDWYGTDHTPEMKNAAERQMEMLRGLSGEAFEIAFMEMMIPHHASAIESATECLLEAHHAEMLNLCSMMIGAQGDEIAQMRLWLCQWYEHCDLK
ncbi:MAG TPA: DUF305 domain-containing protein [Opitutaceae bacterium]